MSPTPTPPKRSKTPKALGPRTLLIELRKAERAMVSRAAIPDHRRAELCAVAQTLRWALGEPNTMTPTEHALLGVDP